MSTTNTDHQWTLVEDASVWHAVPPKDNPEAEPPCHLNPSTLTDGRKAYAFIFKATAQFIVDDANERKTEAGA